MSGLSTAKGEARETVVGVLLPRSGLETLITRFSSISSPAPLALRRGLEALPARFSSISFKRFGEVLRAFSDCENFCEGDEGLRRKGLRVKDGASSDEVSRRPDGECG